MQEYADADENLYPHTEGKSETKPSTRRNSPSCCLGDISQIDFRRILAVEISKLFPTIPKICDVH